MEENGKKITCPHCGSEDMIKSGKTRIGTQRYECKYCGRRSSGDRTLLKFGEGYHRIYCVHCGGQNLRKAAYSHNKSNAPRYYCKDCKRKFVFERRKRITEVELSKEDKRTVLLYVLHFKLSAKEVAKSIKQPYHRVLKFLNAYKKEHNIE